MVQVIHSKVEDVQLPGNNKVDAIVSEWMGFYLLHEGMLDSVIMARDKFLKEDGEMFPESATIYLSPCRLIKCFDQNPNLLFCFSMVIYQCKYCCFPRKKMYMKNKYVKCL